MDSKWVYVKYDVDGLFGKVPISYIEDCETERVEVNTTRNVFWSSNAVDTPESFKTVQRKIMHFEKVRKSFDKKKNITAYYKAYIVLIKDSLEQLNKAISKKRVQFPSQKKQEMDDRNKSAASSSQANVKISNTSKKKVASGKTNLDNLLSSCNTSLADISKSGEDKEKSINESINLKKEKKKKKEKEKAEKDQNAPKGEEKESEKLGESEANDEEEETNSMDDTSKSGEDKEKSINKSINLKKEKKKKKKKKEKEKAEKDHNAMKGEKKESEESGESEANDEERETNSMDECGLSDDSEETENVDDLREKVRVQVITIGVMQKKFRDEFKRAEENEKKMKNLMKTNAELKEKMENVNKELEKQEKKLREVMDLNINFQLAMRPGSSNSVMSTCEGSGNSVDKKIFTGSTSHKNKKDSLDFEFEDNSMLSACELSDDKFDFHTERMQTSLFPSPNQSTGSDFDHKTSPASASSHSSWKRNTVFSKSEFPSGSKYGDKVKSLVSNQIMAVNKGLSDGSKDDTRFVKGLCDLQWDREKMKQLTAATGIVGDSLKKCTPEKLQYIGDLLDKRMDLELKPPGEEERSKRKLEVDAIVCSKFNTVRRDMKKKK